MKRNHLWILLMLFAMGACSNKQNESQANAANVEPVTLEDLAPETKMWKGRTVDRNDAPQNEPLHNQQNSTIKIIRTGNISLESKKIEQSKANLDALLKKYNAYYEQEFTNNNNDFTSYNLTIRVPSNAFDNFLNALEK